MVNWRLFVYERESAKVCESGWSLRPPASSINRKGRAPVVSPSISFDTSHYDICCISHAGNDALMLLNTAAHTVVAKFVSRKSHTWFLATLATLPCVSTNRVALCKARTPGALHVQQGRHKDLRIKA